VVFVQTPDGEQELSLEDFEAGVRDGQISAAALVKFPIITGEGWVRAGDLALFQYLYEPAKIHFRRRFRLGRFPWSTSLLILLQVILFIGLAGQNSTLHLDHLIRAGAKNPAHVFELGETWRLLSANFLHRDVWHLFFNMVFFFNVGATIENTYRKQDYWLIIVASSLGTTLLSGVMSDQTTVGASGIVLGFFGAASVFGHKYSRILPRNYRRYFTGIILPYALFILYVGLITAGTDNWGHLGGLFAGALCALFLQPKLLRASMRDQSTTFGDWSGVLALLLVLFTLVSGVAIRKIGTPFTRFYDQETGLAFVYPSRWSFGANHLGYSARGNELGVTVGIYVGKSSQRFSESDNAKQIFINDELRYREKHGHITSLNINDESPVEIDEIKGTILTASLYTRVGPQLTKNVIIERGSLKYYFVIAVPMEMVSRYEPITAKILESLELSEPLSVIEARKEVAVFPRMASAHAKLGDELAMIGKAEAAKASYLQALNDVSPAERSRIGLARLALDYSGDLLHAERLLSEHQLSTELQIEAAILLAELKYRRGAVDEALATLVATLKTHPSSNLIQKRIRELSNAKISGPRFRYNAR